MLRKKQHKSEESLHVQAHDPFHARVKRKSHLPSEILILVSSHLMTCWSYCVGREGRGGGVRTRNGSREKEEAASIQVFEGAVVVFLIDHVWR